jgi:glyoxylase-like metal-dependent hydrolase (beta-lactamase superfamily II)
MARVNLAGQFNPPSYLDGRIDVYAYLVVTETDVLLIDTGVGEGNEYIERTFEPRRTPIAEELARFGVETADVNLLVNSHLHFDHCGNNRLFPGAEIFVQADELSAARTTRYTVTEWFDYEGARISPVSGDMEIREGIKLLSSPGHTPGHQSVLIETVSSNILIAAQAAFTADEYQRGGDAAQAHEGLEAQYLRSISKLKSVAADGVYFSHDDRAELVEPDLDPIPRYDE